MAIMTFKNSKGETRTYNPTGVKSIDDNELAMLGKAGFISTPTQTQPVQSSVQKLNTSIGTTKLNAAQNADAYRKSIEAIIAKPNTTASSLQGQINRVNQQQQTNYNNAQTANNNAANNSTVSQYNTGGLELSGNDAADYELIAKKQAELEAQLKNPSNRSVSTDNLQASKDVGQYLIPTLTSSQQTGIANLVSSGREFNDTDSRNFATATGFGSTPTAFQGLTGAQATQMVKYIKAGSTPAQAKMMAMQGGAPQSTGAIALPGEPSAPFDNTPIGLPEAEFGDIFEGNQGEFDIPPANDYLDPIGFIESLFANPELQKQQQQIFDKMFETLGAVAGRGQEQANQEAQLGVPDQVKKLQDANITLANMKANFDMMNQRIQQQTVPMPFVIGQQNELAKTAAIEMGAQATLVATLQGNIEYAKQIAKDTVDMKYSDVAAKMQQLQLALQYNQSLMSANERKQATALQVYLSERQNALASKKEEEIAIRNLGIEMAKKGASSAEIREVMNSDSYDRAFESAASWLYEGKSTMTSEQVQLMKTLQTNAADDKDISDYTNSKSAFDQLQATVNSGENTNAADVAILYNYMKVINPGINVREGAVASAADSTGISTILLNAYNNLVKDSNNRLSPNARLEYLNAASTIMNDRLPKYQTASKFYQDQAESLGIDASLILRDFSSGATINAARDTSASTVNSFVNTYGEDTAWDIMLQTATPEDRIKLEQDRANGYTTQEVLDNYNNSNTRSNNQYIQGWGDIMNGFVSSIGPITGYGSPYWKHGLDIDLKVGEPVPAPVSGEVILAGANGGFGNQVKIRTTDGVEYWLGHLQSVAVKKGQRIAAGTLIGKGGNTGKVIPMGGGDGSHLDLTVRNPDGSYKSPYEIAKIFG